MNIWRKAVAHIILAFSYVKDELPVYLKFCRTVLFRKIRTKNKIAVIYKYIVSPVKSIINIQLILVTEDKYSQEDIVL